MGIDERIAQMKERIHWIKEKRGIITKLQAFKFKPFSTKQKQILIWWIPGSPVKDYDGIIADGAIRSGKTVCMSLSFVFWAMKTFSGQNLAMCGETIGSSRYNALLWLKIMLRSRGYKVMDYRVDNPVEISRSGVTNYFYTFGGKDERNQDLIQGITLVGLLCDEVTSMPESFVNQATGRCSVDGNKYWFNCNPDGLYHWFKPSWLDKAGEKNLLVLHLTMEDNLSLSERIKERYRNMYTGAFFKRYIPGLWAMVEGIIYNMFSEERHAKSVLEFVWVLIDGGRYVSINYGTQNTTVFLFWNKGRDEKWYRIREYYCSGKDKGVQKTDAEYGEDLKRFLDGIPVRVAIVDPPAVSLIAELNKCGFTVIQADNAAENGIRLVVTLLNIRRITLGQSCKNTIMELASYI